MAKAFAKDRLRSLVERVERLEEEKSNIATDISEIYKEAKDLGFDTKAMKAVVKLRKMETADRQEFEAIVDLYKSALGMTPLEDRIREATAGESATVSGPATH